MIGMIGHRASRAGKNVSVATALTVVFGLTAGPVGAGLGARRIDPAQVVPLHEIAAEYRETVAEVIRDHTFHRQGESDAFPCPSSLYLSLVNEPLVTLALWKDLSDAPVQLQKVAANRYEGTDGSGSTASWEFVFRSARMHVLLSNLTYVSPHGNARVEARIILVVNAAYYRDNKQTPWVQHNIDAFVKVDSKGWKTVARPLRPVVERILEEQVKEAGYFVSLMSRLVTTYPNWASQVVSGHPAIDGQTKQRFAHVVAQSRSPGASSGRPVVARDVTQTAQSRRR